MRSADTYRAFRQYRARRAAADDDFSLSRRAFALSLYLAGLPGRYYILRFSRSARPHTRLAAAPSFIVATSRRLISMRASSALYFTPPLSLSAGHAVDAADDAWRFHQSL